MKGGRVTFTPVRIFDEVLFFIFAATDRIENSLNFQNCLLRTSFPQSRPYFSLERAALGQEKEGLRGHVEKSSLLSSVSSKPT